VKFNIQRARLVFALFVFNLPNEEIENNLMPYTNLELADVKLFQLPDAGYHHMPSDIE